MYLVRTGGVFFSLFSVAFFVVPAVFAHECRPYTRTWSHPEPDLARRWNTAHKTRTQQGSSAGAAAGVLSEKRESAKREP